MVKGVCLNSLVGPRSKSVKLAFSKCQQYEALFSFSLLYKLVNTLMFTFPRAVAQQCHQCRLSWSPREFYDVHQVPCTWGWVQTSLVPADGQWRKASPVAEAQHRQAWRDGGCSLLKIFIFFFFCKYLTWIIQIRTCWWVADCHFYSHLFRESTENMLQHGHCGPKRRTKREFFRRRTHLEPVMWTLGGWLAGQPASGHHTRTWVPRARRLTTHRRNSCHLPGTGSKPDTQKPRSTCL